MMEKITLFARYAENGASSRLRQWRWREFLATLAYRVEATAFFSDDALRRFYMTKRHPITGVAAAYFRRLRALRQKTSFAIVEYEALPYFPAFLEKALLRHTRYILDFDDDVWTKYDRLPGLRGKFDALVANAAGVSVANHFLQQKVASLNPNVLLLPTPIEELLEPQEKFPVFTLAWIGSQTTRRNYLEPFAGVLRQLAQKVKFELLVIADAPPELPGVPHRFEAWSEKSETLLARCHVGIMPLADDAFARGKSAYKLIQYLGAGIPSVASSIGENRFVLEEGKTGFLVSSPDAWCQAITTLYQDAVLCEAMGRAAKIAARNYVRGNLWERYREFLCRFFEISR